MQGSRSRLQISADHRMRAAAAHLGVQPTGLAHDVCWSPFNEWFWIKMGADNRHRSVLNLCKMKIAKTYLRRVVRRKCNHWFIWLPPRRLADPELLCRVMNASASSCVKVASR